MKKVVCVAAALALLAGAVVVTNRSGAAEEKGKTIKQIMKQGHQAPKGQMALCAKVAGKEPSKEDAEKLLALYKDLAACKPPKGDEASWKEKTTALITATEGVIKGEKGASAALKKAVNCMACHKVHKG